MKHTLTYLNLGIFKTQYKKNFIAKRMAIKSKKPMSTQRLPL